MRLSKDAFSFLFSLQNFLRRRAEESQDTPTIAGRVNEYVLLIKTSRVLIEKRNIRVGRVEKKGNRGRCLFKSELIPGHGVCLAARRRSRWRAEGRKKKWTRSLGRESSIPDRRRLECHGSRSMRSE